MWSELEAKIHFDEFELRSLFAGLTSVIGP